MTIESFSFRWAPWCILACLLPFLPGIYGPFLLDDLPNLQNIPKTGETWLAWYHAVFGNASGLLRRPLANLSFLLNYRLFGADAISFKLVNLALHGLTGYLVYNFLRRLLPRLLPEPSAEKIRVLAMAAAILWTVHPIQVSTALYVVQRMTQLATIGMLAALIVAMDFLARPLATRLEGLKATMAVAVIATLGLLAKETAALTPLLLFVVLTSLPEAARAGIGNDPGKRLFSQLSTTIPLVLMAFLLMAYLPSLSAGYSGRGFTLGERLLTQPFVIGHYLGTIFIPDIRSMGLYLDGVPVRSLDSWLNWLGIATVALAMAASWWIRKRFTLLAFATLWFLACHALESTVIPLELAFEHRNYLALLGPALLMASGALALGRILSPPLHRLVIVASLVVLALSTFYRSHEWGEPSRFIRAEAAHHPDSPRALNSLASLEFELGNIDAAARITQQLGESHPDSFWANALHLNLLACTDTAGKPQYAKLLEITRRNPQRRETTLALISILTNVVKHQCTRLDAGELDRFMTTLITLMPSADDRERVYILRSMLADHEQRPADRLALLKSAAEANPTGIESRLLLGYYYLNNGQLDSASEQVTQLRQLIGFGTDLNRLRELEQFIEGERRSTSTTTFGNP